MPPEITSAEFWQPIMPYVGTAIIAFFAFIAALFLAAKTLINTSVGKEKTYLDLVNDLRTEALDAKKERQADQDLIASLQAQIAKLQDDFLAAKEREIERAKEFATLTLERDALKKELARIASELEKMRAEIQRLIDERDALNRKLEDERHLRREAEVARIHVESKLEAERTKLNAQIETLQHKVAVLEQSIDLLKNSTKDDLKVVAPEDKPEA